MSEQATEKSQADIWLDNVRSSAMNQAHGALNCVKEMQREGDEQLVRKLAKDAQNTGDYSKVNIVRRQQQEYNMMMSAMANAAVAQKDGQWKAVHETTMRHVWIELLKYLGAGFIILFILMFIFK